MPTFTVYQLLLGRSEYYSGYKVAQEAHDMLGNSTHTAGELMIDIAHAVKVKEPPHSLTSLSIQHPVCLHHFIMHRRIGFEPYLKQTSLRMP